MPTIDEPAQEVSFATVVSMRAESRCLGKRHAFGQGLPRWSPVLRSDMSLDIRRLLSIGFPPGVYVNRFRSPSTSKIQPALGMLSGFGPAFSFSAWVNSCRPETICGAFVRTVLASFSE